MSVHIDRSFLFRISTKLKRFSRKKDDLFNFRCPLCGDSQKNLTKCRGYVYRKKDNYCYMCHNCGVNLSFYNFIKAVEPELIDEYTLCRFRDTMDATDIPKKEEIITAPPVFKKSLHLPTISSLHDDHYAKTYITGRMIPAKWYGNLYYSCDFDAFVKSCGIDKNIPPNDERIVIPFHNRNGEVIGFQGRTLTDSKLRYITIKLGDEPIIFGMNNVNLEEKVYCFEGPFDSMFVENSVAVCSSNLASVTEHIPKEQAVLVFDNEPRNKEIVNLMDKAIDEHFSVLIWPEMIEYKDVNEIILKGFDIDDLNDIIETNVHVNLRAKLEFYRWRKI